MDDNSSNEVEFDMSFSTNARINYLLWNSNIAQESDDASKWFKQCKNLLKECCIKMIKQGMKDTEDLTQHPELINHFHKINEIEKAMNDLNLYNSNYNQKLKYQPPREVFDLLFQWEIQLRFKLDKMGLLLKQKDDYAL